MASIVSVTRDPREMPGNCKPVERLSVAWTSDSSGNATGTIDRLYGYVMKMITNPDDSAAPTDNYDITLVDENGIDALAGAGIDRDTANTEQVYPTASGAQIPVFVAGTHTFTVANAGNAKSGVCVFYLVESL